ncbi:MAG: modulator protein [Rhodobacteraceae bacterium]|nr:MAG: modulator protein [Paracoccaceae bacterium]
MSKNLENMSEELVQKAKTFGATSAESTVVQNKSLTLETKNTKLEKVETAESLELGLRVFINSQSASVSISNFNSDAIDEMILRAIAMAKEAIPDELSGPADINQILSSWNMKSFELFDITYDDQNFEKYKNLALEVESAALEVTDISQSESAGFSSNYSNFHFTTSNGFSSGYQRTAFGLYCSAIAGTGSSMERDFASEGRTFFNDLPSASSIGLLAANRATARLKPKRPPTGLYPVLFDQRISSSLIGHLTAAINGMAICRGSSWLLGSLNKKILPENLSLCEDPNRPRIAGSRPFDAEGLPTTQKNFVENGVLKNYILDLRSARKLNLEPLGNAYRSLASAPQPGVGNLELSPGNSTCEQLLGNIKSGLLVTSLIGATINQNTGDYSRGANGFWIENGQVAFPVNECTIAGNLKEMLLNVIAGNDGKSHLSKVVPSLLIEKMTVASR